MHLKTEKDEYTVDPQDRARRPSSASSAGRIPFGAIFVCGTPHRSPNSQRPSYFNGILHTLGVPAPAFMGWTTIFIELLGGLANRSSALISVPMAVILIVAALTVHLPYGFSSIKLQSVTNAGAQFGPPGYETDLLYLACLATLVMGGSGPFAVDRLIARLRQRHEIRSRPVGRVNTPERGF